MLKSSLLRTAALLPLLAAPACAADKDAEIGFIAFGDSGYHYGYMDPKEYKKPLKTLEEFTAAEKADAAEDYLPLESFQMPPAYFHPEIGGYVTASGQDAVARAMTAYCEKALCQFATLAGDNIYPDGATAGADGKDDGKRFEDIFAVPYADFGKDMPDFKIYAALGNHDWDTSREGAMAQVAYLEQSSKFYMDGIFYRVSPPATNGEVEIFVIDTDVMLAGLEVREAMLNPDGSEVKDTPVDQPDEWIKPANDAERNMAKWLEDAMASSTAKWKLVVAHHPLWSSAGGKFEQARVLRRVLLPTLCKYADAYLSGHEHSMEMHETSCAAATGNPDAQPLPEILSGAAAKQRPLNPNFMAYQEKTYPEYKPYYRRGMVWGFAHVSLKGDEAKVTVLTTPNDESGTPVEDFSWSFSNRP
ncbi:metallophosphoesterase [Gimibacter soli]|uniref:Metallophosphoesterase n=1 Tax=Gimibacter soli TaxID=3024400 RepID=A0AAF0BJM8_9PROT|nr:metallophosphoesterase [Gimibacter soli]WCL53294.1 metallophosphoesterase [Gimibacter soli]